MEEMTNSFNKIIVEPEKKVPIGRHRRELEVNIKMSYVVKIGFIWLGIETRSGPL
jgi:sporulation protein YlmC with PRC-barrel domain